MNKKYRNTNEKERLEKVYSKEAVAEAEDWADSIGWIELVYDMCTEFGYDFEGADYEDYGIIFDPDYDDFYSDFNIFSVIDFGSIQMSVCEWAIITYVPEFKK